MRSKPVYSVPSGDASRQRLVGFCNLPPAKRHGIHLLTAAETAVFLPDHPLRAMKISNSLTLILSYFFLFFKLFSRFFWIIFYKEDTYFSFFGVSSLKKTASAGSHRGLSGRCVSRNSVIFPLERMNLPPQTSRFDFRMSHKARTACPTHTRSRPPGTGAAASSSEATYD